MMSGTKTRDARRGVYRSAIRYASLLALLLAPMASDAQRRLPTTIDYTDRLEHVYAETLTWLASGTVPGTGGVRVDTIISTGVDTTFPFDFTGAEAVTLEIGTIRAGTDSINVLYQFQVSTSADTNAVWHTFVEEYGAVQSNANDTIAMLLFTPVLVEVPDTSYALANATLQTGVTTAALANRALASNMRYGRVVARGRATAGDTALPRIIATIRYER